MRKDNIVKAAILQAAERVFQKWGINKTTMEDIAHEAGKGKSTLYYYFKSKEDVLEAVAAAQATRILSAVKEEIAPKATAKEKLLAYVYTTFREIRHAITLYEIVRGEIKALKALVDRAMKKYDAEDGKILESILDFGIRRGEFKSIGFQNIKSAVRAIQTVKRSLTIDVIIDSGDKELIDLIIRLFFEGL